MFVGVIFIFFVLFSKHFSSIAVVSGQPDPPSFIVSDIDATTATIQMESEHNKEAVRYHIKYREKTNDEEEEMKINWIEKQFEDNKDEYVLKELQSNTEYEVLGCYKLLTPSIWSRYSKPQSIKTSVFSMFPSFEWDPNHKHKEYVLSNNNKTVTKSSGCSGSILSKNELSAETISSVIWEITIRKYDNIQNCHWMLGFVPSDKRDSIKFDGCLGGNNDQYQGHMLWLYGGYDEFRTHVNSSSDFKFKFNQKPKNMQPGDRLEMRFDFETKQCKEGV